MARLFDILIISGTSPSDYTIYYDVVGPTNYATRVSTSLPATDVTYTDLTTSPGVRVSVPDTTIKILLHNNDCND